MYRVTLTKNKTKKLYFFTKYFAVRYIIKNKDKAFNVYLERLGWKVL